MLCVSEKAKKHKFKKIKQDLCRSCAVFQGTKNSDKKPLVRFLCPSSWWPKESSAILEN